MPYTIAATEETRLKRKPLDSTQLQPFEWLAFPKGQDLEALAVGPVDPHSGHLRITFDESALMQDADGVARAILNTGYNTWWLYASHLTSNGTELDNNPVGLGEQRPTSKLLVYGQKIQVKGVGRVYLNAPISEATPHFKWYEATSGGERLPENEWIADNIKRTAEVLEEAREFLGGRAFKINSWYRPPAINRAVGGASQSQHLNGSAVDFVAAGLSPKEVYARLNPWWGARGGLASSSVFTHIDTRGYRARWSYPY